MTNILLSDWNTPFNLAPFDKIEDKDFSPALDLALEEDRQATQAIADNPQAPTFQNTIEALMETDKALEQVLSVFYTVAGADSNETREALMRDFSPKLSAHSSEIYNNEALFLRIKTLWEARDTLELSPEQARVLMLMHRNFVRAGAALTGSAKERMTEIKSRLAILGTAFSQNLLHDERAWFMELTEEETQQLPSFLQSAARAAAEEKGSEGAIVTLSRSLIVPFLQFSPNRNLREKAYQAWAARGNTQAIKITGLSPKRCSPCAKRCPRFWDIKTLPALNWKQKWPKPLKMCAVFLWMFGRPQKQEPTLMPQF